MRIFPLLLLSLFACFGQSSFDVILENGRIVDGTGNAWFYGDLAIRDGRIARITAPGLMKNQPARERLDVRGMVVAPGFIDIQGQSNDQLLFGDGRLLSKVTQGVTTEILGEGWTNAPANEKTVQIDTGEPDAAKRHRKEFEGEHGFGEWLQAMEKHGASVNFGSFTGAATLRMYAKGMAPGPANADEVELMCRLMRHAMQEGSFGLASALIYPPGEYAGTDELAAIAKAMVPYGGVYITHMRSEADQLLEAIDEAIEIGRRGGVPVEIYHLKAAGRRNWDKMPQAIAKINSAREAGMDVGADMYLYVAGGTGLAACLPPWASANGKLLDNLKDPAMRAKIREEIQNPTAKWENLGALATPEGVLIAEVTKEDNKRYVGKRLSEIAAMTGKDWMDAAMDLILSEGAGIGTIYFMMSEENIKLQLRQPWIKFGSDADGLDPETAQGLAHPRAYGNFARVLGKYVREQKVIPLEDAIRKLSSAVARRLSIPDRGLLQEGMWADVVVFDPAAIADRATFENPHQLSAGVKHVFVNGVAVLRDGKHSGAMPGRLLRGPGYTAR
jgi:dihydroorotase/N-acyl-D-amino-acid deacylase